MKNVNEKLLLLFEELEKEVKGFIRKDQVKEAIEKVEELGGAISIEWVKENLISSADLKRLERDHRRALITFEDYSIRKNRIIVKILDSLDYYKEEIRNQQQGKIRKEILHIPQENLEKVIGPVNNIQGIALLEKALLAAPSICRVHVGNEFGTGFLVADHFIFTNHHIINSENVNQAKVEFGFQRDIYGQMQSSKVYNIIPETLVCDKALDFAFVKVNFPKGENAQWGALKINLKFHPKPGEMVSIIQHPKGEDKKISLGNIVNYEHPFIIYHADTESGSSGSPVFNQNLEVIALHRGFLKKNPLVGNDQGGNGNRGVLMKTIIKQYGDQIQHVKNGIT